jgi:Concanavalin A-like lectin/glucanases superfamily
MLTNTYIVTSNSSLEPGASFPFVSGGSATSNGGGYAACNFIGSANSGTVTPNTQSTTNVAVSLLLHLDTGFQDSSVNNLTPNVSNVSISNTTFEFGGGSLQFNAPPLSEFGGANLASVSYPVTPGGPLDISTGDYTIEFWFNPSPLTEFLPNDYTLLTTNIEGGTDFPFVMDMSIAANGATALFVDVDSKQVNAGNSIPFSEFTAIAFVVHNNSGQFFVNGVMSGPAVSLTNRRQDDAVAFNVGNGSSIDGINALVGFIDELRVTKLALYTANYTPSTVPLSNTVPIPLGNPVSNLNNVQIEVIASTDSGTPWGFTDEPVFVVSLPVGTPQTFFTSVNVSSAAACTGTFTFNTSTAFFTTTDPDAGGDLASWVWSNPSMSSAEFFNPNFLTTVTFTTLPSLTLSVTDTTFDTVNVAWVDIANTASAYNVLRNNVFIAQVPNTVFTFEDTGLTANTTYLYEVDGVDGSNNTLYSATTNATTEIAPVGQSVLYLAEYNSGPFLTANGDLNVGGNIFVYFEDTLTPCNTFTDVTGLTLNPNPIQITVDGLLPNQIWTPVGQNVRIRMMDSANNLLDDKDNIPGVPTFTDVSQVFVIDSVFSTDTANAASANAANWDYKVANGAFALANTLANNLANVQNSVTSLSSNTVVFQSQAVTINVGNTINFVNSPFANVNMTVNPNGVDIQIIANAESSGATTNSSVTINGITFQWAFYAHTVAGEQGPFTDDFPVPFANECLSIQMTTQGGPGAAGLVVAGKPTKSAFTWFSAFGGADSTGQFVFAIGI